MSEKTKYAFVSNALDNSRFGVDGELVQVAALDNDGNIITFIYARAEQAEYDARRLSCMVSNIVFATLRNGTAECKFLNSKQITVKE